MAENAAVAAIEYALKCDCGLDFLNLWLHGDFEAIRRDWPEVPDEVFVGADPLALSAESLART